ncbi:MAG TPA: 3-oxoadipate enol-lactonase [Vicinamibacterales bacterium]|nr:3-oxoadipate enol-lactonase [Vicinamibacterales bacterium]
MPFCETGTGRLYFRLDGADDEPVVVLHHSLGLDHGMWDAQAADLAPHFRVLRFDARGHGASPAPADTTATIETLARDVLSLADSLRIDRFAFCGLSIGGMVGQWLGVHAPQRLTHLVLANTSPRVTDPSAMEARRAAVLKGGMPAVVDTAMSRFFSTDGLTRRPAIAGQARRTLLATSPEGYAACCAAVRDFDGRDALSRITPRTLVIAGDLDVSMPWEGHGALLASSIPGASVARLHAAHLSNLEQPRSFSAALLRFLVPADADVRAAGERVRRAALGDAHVDRSIAATTDLTRDFQDLITRTAWGSIWTRPGLDHRTRRLIVLVITASLGRWEEFRLHLRAGLARELEWTDVEEVLLQTAVYAGIPAANTAFQIASEERSRPSGSTS